jgi:hypothetical protein
MIVGEPLPALLLDESDSGFFFAEPDHVRTTFLPRGQVSMMSFSEKPIYAPAAEKPKTEQNQSAQPAPQVKPK